MGSSFSILNDTEHDVWITHGVNWTALALTVGGVGAVLTGGLGLAAAGATAGVGGILSGGGALIMAEGGIIMGTAATTIAGLTATQLSVAAAVTTMTTAALATTLKISEAEAKKIQEHVKKFQKGSKLVKPGNSYKFSGSLSLTMTVYVMNDAVQEDSRACWTGPTAGSNFVYPISKYFKKLDVKMKEEHKVTAYKE